MRDFNTLKNIRVYTYTRNIRCIRVHTKISNTLYHYQMYHSERKMGCNFISIPLANDKRVNNAILSLYPIYYITISNKICKGIKRGLPKSS